MSYTGKNIDLSKYEKYGKEVELSKMEVELSAIQDVLKEVSANGAGRDKARQLIRNSFSEAAKALEILERIPSRNKKIEQLSNKIKSQVKELGLNVNDLPQEMKFAVEGLYIDNQVDNDIKSLRGAIGSLKNSSEV